MGELERSHALNIKIFLTGADLGDDDICDIAVKKDEKIWFEWSSPLFRKP